MSQKREGRKLETKEEKQKENAKMETKRGARSQAIQFPMQESKSQACLKEMF